MNLDGAGNLYCQGTLNIGNSRISSRNSTNQGVAPSVSAWNLAAGVAKGFWVDGNGLWFGNTDAGGNPTRADALFDNNGYCTFYSQLQINGSVWAAGGLTTTNQLVLYSFHVQGQSTFDGNVGCGGNLDAATVRAHWRSFISSTSPTSTLYNAVNGNCMGMWVDAALSFGYLNGNGDPSWSLFHVNSTEFVSAVPGWFAQPGYLKHGMTEKDLDLPGATKAGTGDMAGITFVDTAALIANLFKRVKQLEEKVNGTIH
jgi:hypothetical protein